MAFVGVLLCRTSNTYKSFVGVLLCRTSNTYKSFVGVSGTVILLFNAQLPVVVGVFGNLFGERDK